MARSHARPAPIRAALAASCAVIATAAAARVVVQRPRLERESAAAPCHSAGADVAWSAFAGRVYDEIERRTRKLRVPSRTRVARAILEETVRSRLDPRIVLAVIQVESGYDPGAVSRAGAVGLMQLLGPTMREEAARSRLASADPRDPVANVRAGIRYLSRLAASFDDLEMALLAYNAGPGRIRRHLRAGAVPGRLLAYPRMVQAELDRIAARWGHEPLRLAARSPSSPPVLAAHAAPPASRGARATPSLRPGAARAFEGGGGAASPGFPAGRLAARPAVRSAARRRRARAGRGAQPGGEPAARTRRSRSSSCRGSGGFAMCRWNPDSSARRTSSGRA